MKRCFLSVAAVVVILPMFLDAQSVVIPAGTPEDKALQGINSENDPQKRLALYQDFVQQFSTNPAAVTYGNWQIAQYYQGAGEPQKALEYGDKALAGAPQNLDLLGFQAGLAQQVKNNAKVIDYAARGGEAYHSIGKESKPEGMSDQDFAEQSERAKTSGKSSYEFLEAAAYNAIAEENNAKTRMAYIDRFTPAFPDSRLADSVASYALVALSQLNDMARLVSYGEKSLAANPNSLPTLLLLANAYADDAKPGSVAKAVTYSQKAIAVAKADAPDADRSRQLSAGVAHSTLGYAYMKQDKTAAAVPELKAATGLLKGKDEQSYALAAYRLGFAYGKLNRMAEAREILLEAVKIQGPVQQPARELLDRVGSARAKAK
jgi:tetratricopeptide (TPR) repeat protein